MASINNFKVHRNNDKKGKNIFSIGRNINKSGSKLSKSERIMEGVGIWTSFYRSNPHKFVEDYLGVKLKLFQQILIMMMMHNNYFMYLASRGQGKTYLTALYAVTRAILMPSSKIVIAAGRLSQSRAVIEKIEEIRVDSLGLQREIKDYSVGSKDPYVTFHNGSWIKTVAANDGARSKRANCLIVDKFVPYHSNMILQNLSNSGKLSLRQS